MAEPLDLLSCPPLTFHAPDYVAFPCLALALEAAHTGGSATAVLNGANEEAVGQFLAGQLSFSGIAEQVAYAMAAVPAVQFTDWLVPSGHIHTTTSTLEYQSPLALVICA